MLCQFRSELRRPSLEAIEQITPHEVCQAAATLIGLREAWGGALPYERKALCQLLLKEVAFDFEKKAIVSIRPRAEYAILFQILPSLKTLGEGAFAFHFEAE
jgi:hypothetical protein